MLHPKSISGLAGGVLLAVLCSAGTANATPASACDLVVGNLVQNCGFETGDFSHWNKNTPTGPSNLTVTTPGYTGSDKATFAGGVGETNPAVDTISQNITGITPGAAYEISLEFTSDGSTPNGGFLGFADAGGFHQITNFTDIGLTPWTEFDYTFVPLYPGFTLLIGGNDPNGSWSVDDFVLKAVPVPEPVTLSLFGAGLAGIAALRRKKTSKSA